MGFEGKTIPFYIIIGTLIVALQQDRKRDSGGHIYHVDSNVIRI